MQIYKWVERKLIFWGVPRDNSDLTAALTIGFVVLALAVIGNYIAKRFIARSIAVIVKRTEVTWDDLLLERKVFNGLSHLVPGMVFFTLGPIAFTNVPDAKEVVRRASLVYMALVAATVFDRLMTASVEIYQQLALARQRPFKSYAQVFKILNYLVATILLISIIVGESPFVLITGVGALSAVLLLVFKDPLLGLVASVQLSANDMVRKGDPIEVPKHGIEGEVIDMSLTTVKVQGADKAIATIPNYTLVSDSFRNLRGIREAGMRRIRRGLQIDVHSVRFVGRRKLAELAAHPLIQKEMPDLATRFLGDREPTNIGVFRLYMEACARSHPKIASDMALLVRQLGPTERGIGLELMCYVRELDYGPYEILQAELFEHFVAMVPEFDLRLFQNPRSVTEGVVVGETAEV